VNKLISLFCLWIVAANAQGKFSISSSVTQARPGDTISLKISYSASDAAGLQWSLIMPPPLPPAVATASTQAAAAGKAVTCNPAGPICLLIGGVNQVQAGDQALYNVTFPSTAPSGIYIFSLTSTLGVRSSGDPLSVAADVPATVVLLSRFDLNGDGKIDAADQALAISQAVGVTPCGTADFNGDGKCNVVDVQLLILAFTPAPSPARQTPPKKTRGR